MIVFLNFAPIEYQGGAERKIYQLFELARKKEESFIISVDSSLSSIYSKFVLNTPFENRVQEKLDLDENSYLKITLMSFLPYSEGWKKMRKKLADARIIYAKGDLTEFLILLYFGGVGIFDKVIAGIRSPWVYVSPQSFIDHFHNLVYKSFIGKFFLKKAKKVHVLTKRDKDYFETVFHLQNVVEIPNDTDIPPIKALQQKRNDGTLKIIFIGELIPRKGVDILIETIESSPKEYMYHIVGEGPMRKQIEDLASRNQCVTYHGYLDRVRLYTLLGKSDVLLCPSRAEGFGGVILEAMSMGLVVVDSPEIYLGLPSYCEVSPKNNISKDYLPIMSDLLKKKKFIDKFKIKSYCDEHYSKKTIYPRLLIELFNF